MQAALGHEVEVTGLSIEPLVPSNNCTAPDNTKNDSLNVRWKCGHRATASGPMSQR